MREEPSEPARDVEPDERPFAPEAFEQAACDPEQEHVAEQMKDVGVHEHMREEPHRRRCARAPSVAESRHLIDGLHEAQHARLERVIGGGQRWAALVHMRLNERIGLRRKAVHREGNMRIRVTLQDGVEVGCGCRDALVGELIRVHPKHVNQTADQDQRVGGPGPLIDGLIVPPRQKEKHARDATRFVSVIIEVVSDARKPFLRFAIRDGILIALTLVFSILDRMELPHGGMFIAIATGVLVPVVGFLLHEWGHLLGTWMSGAVGHAPSTLMAFFLFHFDVSKATRAQFLAMSFGGYLATFFVVLGLIVWVDLSRLSGMIALVLSVLGIGVTVALELPTTWRVWRGDVLPTGGVYVGEPGRKTG